VALGVLELRQDCAGCRFSKNEGTVHILRGREVRILSVNDVLPELDGLRNGLVVRPTANGLWLFKPTSDNLVAFMTLNVAGDQISPPAAECFWQRDDAVNVFVPHGVFLTHDSP